MRLSPKFFCCRLIAAAFISLLIWRAHAQKSEMPIIVAQDAINGPTGGAHSIELLTVFSNGTVTYSVQSKVHKSFTSKIKPDDVRKLADLLNLQDIRELPNDLASKTQPIDFFWDQSLKINRGDAMQAIHIENFYPFLNLSGPVYPQKLIELECKLQDIKSSASKQQNGDGDWCKEILAHNFPENDSYRCTDEEVQRQVEEGVGWGPVRLGATFASIERSIGKGTPGETFSDVRFVEYRSRGIEISFERTKNDVHAIYFYNHQLGSGQFGVFCGQVAKGINWDSIIEDVRRAYGHPSADFIQGNSGRLQYSGIDFRFENGKLVRIGVPGR